MEKHSLVKTSALNLGGGLVPPIVGLAVVPLIISGVGLDKFALLSLASIVLGYFALFDFGLSRAITRSVARSWHFTGRVPSIVWVAVLVQLAFGAIGGGVLAFVAPSFVTQVLRVQPQTADEVVRY